MSSRAFPKWSQFSFRVGPGWRTVPTGGSRGDGAGFPGPVGRASEAALNHPSGGGCHTVRGHPALWRDAGPPPTPARLLFLAPPRGGGPSRASTSPGWGVQAQQAELGGRWPLQLALPLPTAWASQVVNVFILLEARADSKEKPRGRRRKGGPCWERGLGITALWLERRPPHPDLGLREDSAAAPPAGVV